MQNNKITKGLERYFSNNNTGISKENIFKEKVTYFDFSPNFFQEPVPFKNISFQYHNNPDYFISFFQSSLQVFFLPKTLPKSHYYADCGSPCHKQFSLMKDDSIVMQFFYFFLLQLFDKARECNLPSEKLIIAFLKATKKDPSFQGFFIQDLLLRISYLFLDLDFDAVRFSEENKYKRCVIEDFFNCFFQLNPMTLEEKQNDSSFYYDITKNKNIRLLIEEESNTWLPLNRDKWPITDFKFKLENEESYLEGKKLKQEYFNGDASIAASAIEYKKYLGSNNYIKIEKRLDSRLIPIFLFAFQNAIEYIQYTPKDTQPGKSFFLEIAVLSFQSAALCSRFLNVFQNRHEQFPYIYPQLALLKKRSEIESFIDALVKEQGKFKAASTIAIHYEACYFFDNFYPLAYYLKTYKNERTEKDKMLMEAAHYNVRETVKAFKEYFDIEENQKGMDIITEEEKEKITRAVGIII